LQYQGDTFERQAPFGYAEMRLELNIHRVGFLFNSAAVTSARARTYIAMLVVLASNLQDRIAAKVDIDNLRVKVASVNFTCL
jgi:hypothetical protein